MFIYFLVYLFINIFFPIYFSSLINTENCTSIICKKNIITKGTVKDLIQTARNRYQANLPGLAVKLGACTRHYQSNSEELKKFTSFKNFLYKTVKISEPN